MQAYADPGAREIGVDEAFERLYRTYARDVYRYSLAVLRNAADAEDITQVTFLNAYRAYLRGEEPRRPKHWLIKIAHNACRSRHLRSVRRPQEVPFEETLAAIPIPAEETPKLEELLEALGRLPFNQRAALVMRELEGRSYAEIAETLEVSVAAVETLIFRARRTLRRDRSLVGVLGSVQLPPSLASFVGGGGGAAAVAGGGLAVGSGLLVKAALVVAAGVVAGAIGPVVGARVVHHRNPATVALSPLTVVAAKRTAVTAAPAGIRVLRGPVVVVKRQGRTVVITQGAVGTGTPVPFQQQIELGGGTAPAPQSQQLAGATGVAATSGPAAAGSSASSSAAAATQAVTTTAKSAVTQATQTVAAATSSASPLPVATEPPPTSTVAAPPPPPLPVDASPVTSALPPTPTVTLPDLP